MGIEAAGFIHVGAAEPNVESFSVPGKSGTLTYWDGSYANREITAPSFLLSEGLVRDVDSINAWLISSQEYDKLILSHDPEHFYLARAVRGISEDVRADILTPFDLEFDALPQKYLKSGAREYAAGAKIYNPTKFKAFPIWKIHVEGTVQLTVGENRAVISGTGGDVVLDTETGIATAAGVNVSDKISFENDLVLMPGVNEISISGGTLRYIPRWWTI